MKLTFSTITGLILLAINMPFGWFGALWCIYYAKLTKKKYYYTLSAVIYMLSWIMLAAGVYLCGEKYAVEFFKKYGTDLAYPTIIITLCIIIILFIFRKRIFQIKK